MNLTFDIETGPAPEAELKAFEPEFEPPKNLKDPEKIAAAIAEKRAAWYADAALSPITGRVLAIGYQSEIDERVCIEHVGMHEVDEETVIGCFFDRVRGLGMGANGKLVGFNIHDFDLPFLCRRALALGLRLPAGFMPTGGSRFYWPPWIVDLRAIWGFGQHQPAGSLGVVCRFLGLGEKSGKGADFARLFNGSDEERRTALAYLDNDVRLTALLASRLGINSP